MNNSHDDSIVFSNLSNAVLAEAQGIWPETGAYFIWRRATIRLMVYWHYFSGGESGRHRIRHSLLAPKMHPRASPDTAVKILRRDLDGAEMDFKESGFWPIGFKRGTREFYDKDGNRTSNPDKADHRKTKYIDTEYWWTEPGAEFLQLIRQSIGDANLMARDRAGRIAGLAEIIKDTGSHYGRPIIPDKSPKPKPEKTATENGGITVARALHELQQMPRSDQVQFGKDFVEAMTSYLISDSQEYDEGAHILSKIQTAVVIAKHSLEDLRQRVAKHNAAGRSSGDATATARALALRAHQDNAAMMLANLEQWTIQADADGLPEVADCWRHFAHSFGDLRWAINVERKAKPATEGGNQ